MANSIQITGRLTTDPIIKSKNKKYALFTLAHNTKKNKVIFLDVISFDENASYVESYLEKGKQVYVDGYLEPYIDESGKFKGVRIIAEDCYSKEPVLKYNTIERETKTTKSEENNTNTDYYDVFSKIDGSNDMPF